MKVITYFIILMFASTACASSNVLNIKSWESIETNTLKKAYISDLKWADKPELYVFYLFELSNLKNISYEYSADRIEDPRRVDISITRNGFLDDSVRGDTQRIKLAKNSDGEWERAVYK